MLEHIAFILSVLACISSLILLAIATVELLNPSFKFWPPPKDEPWKKTLFMTLFRIVVYGLVIASIIYLWTYGLQSSTSVNILAMILLLCGFIIAFYATGALGWANAFGSKEGLRTDGIFAYSRNPIYVATWFGLAGWALLVPVASITVTLCLWALLYVVAIFLEERWLLKEYGKPFSEFCHTVRRFF
jgi:protein-S-isoprenylcysteine O-methyltransferase Ste14